MGRDIRTLKKAVPAAIPVLKNPVLEQRGDHRHTLELDTEVHFEDQGFKGMFRCCTQNIGLGGAFIPCRDLPVESNMEIKLVFSANKNASMKPGTYQVKAQVARKSELGAGLVFSLLGTDQLQDFRRFIFKAKVAARQEIN